MPEHALPIFVINLAHARDRRARMERLLARQNIACTVIDAVDGRNLDSTAQAFWRAAPERAMLNAGEIGCLLSHCKVWQQIADQMSEVCIVLEDDLCLSDQFGDVLQHLIAKGADADFDLLRLETDYQPALVERRHRPLGSAFRYHRMQRIRAARSGAYAISRKAAQAMLLAAPAMQQPIDAELFDAKRSALAIERVCQLMPALAHQAELDPALIRTNPFLASNIQELGIRMDRLTGRKRGREALALRTARRLLRPLKWAALELLLAPTGWRYTQISGPPSGDMA